MKARHREIVLAFAENDMKVRATARSLYCVCNTVHFHLEKIHEQYGLDPKRFYDLCKLVEMAKEE